MSSVSRDRGREGRGKKTYLELLRIRTAIPEQQPRINDDPESGCDASKDDRPFCESVYCEDGVSGREPEYSCVDSGNCE